VADASVWIAIVNFLACFSAHKAVDEYGVDIPVAPKFSTGFTVFVESRIPESSLLMSCYFSHPEIFPCRIVPRFPDASVKTLAHLTGLGTSVDITSEI
jgi:hypothetical protein